MIAYTVPEGFPRSTVFTVTVAGTALDVGHTKCADFVSLSMDAPLEIEVRVQSPVGHAVVRPAHCRITPAVESNRLTFILDKPRNVSVEIEGLPPLFVFAGAPESDTPSSTDPNVRWLAAGKVYEAGEIELKAGQTLYVEGGAVLRGSVKAVGCSNVTVKGRGIIDGSYWSERGQRRRGVLFEDCDDVRVDGVTIVNPAGWTLVFYACHGVHVSDVREIGDGFGSDGVDVVSSRDVVVEDCFLRNGDDNLVVKAFGPQEGRGRGGNVSNLLFQRCVLLGHGGSAIEIGHELRADEVSGVVFRDCDILHVHGHGAAISIHNADRAAIHDIRYENIRIEHHFKHLVDFRVFTSRWGKDSVRGSIRDVLLKDITVKLSEYNSGYTVSLIGGFDPDHQVVGVVFENLLLDGRKARTVDDLDLYLRHCQGIEFR